MSSINISSPTVLQAWQQLNTTLPQKNPGVKLLDTTQTAAVDQKGNKNGQIDTLPELQLALAALNTNNLSLALTLQNKNTLVNTDTKEFTAPEKAINAQTEKVFADPSLIQIQVPSDQAADFIKNTGITPASDQVSTTDSAGNNFTFFLAKRSELNPQSVSSSPDVTLNNGGANDGISFSNDATGYTADGSKGSAVGEYGINTQTREKTVDPGITLGDADWNSLPGYKTADALGGDTHAALNTMKGVLPANFEFYTTKDGVKHKNPYYAPVQVYAHGADSLELSDPEYSNQISSEIELGNGESSVNISGDVQDPAAPPATGTGTPVVTPPVVTPAPTPAPWTANAPIGFANDSRGGFVKGGQLALNDKNEVSFQSDVSDNGFTYIHKGATITAPGVPASKIEDLLTAGGMVRISSNGKAWIEDKTGKKQLDVTIPVSLQGGASRVG